MFDITSWKLILLGMIALLVVGPKDLPVLLRTLGKYMGMVKRQAAEFRAQFDEAIRESEFADLKKEVEDLTRKADETVKEAGRSFESHVDGIKSEVDQTIGDIAKTESPAAAPVAAVEPLSPPPELSTLPAPVVAEAPPPKLPEPVLESAGPVAAETQKTGA